MKALIRLSFLLLPCLLVSCTREDGSFTGFSLLVFSLIGVAIVVLIARYLAINHMDWKNNPDDANRFLGKVWEVSERFGNWMENKEGFLGKKNDANRVIVIAIVEAALAIVFLLIPVFTHRFAGFYVASLVLFALALHILEIYAIADDSDEKLISNGKYIAYAIGDFLLILGAIVVIFFIIAMAMGSSSSNNSRLSSINNNNDDAGDDNTGPEEQQGRMNTYTVRYRYPSGSAIKDELQNFQFDHQPSVADVKAKIKSMGWGIDTSKVEVYYIAFGSNNRWADDNLI